MSRHLLIHSRIVISAITSGSKNLTYRADSVQGLKTDNIKYYLTWNILRQPNSCDILFR